MMIMGDKKNILNQILGPNPSEETKEAVRSALSGIADDLISSVKEGNTAGVEAALSAAFAECSSQGQSKGE